MTLCFCSFLSVVWRDPSERCAELSSVIIEKHTIIDINIFPGVTVRPDDRSSRHSVNKIEGQIF